MKTSTILYRQKAVAARRQPIVDGSTVLDKPEVQREAAGEASATMPHDTA